MSYVRNKKDGYVLVATPHLLADTVNYEPITDAEAKKAIGKEGASVVNAPPAPQTPPSNIPTDVPVGETVGGDEPPAQAPIPPKKAKKTPAKK